MKIRYSPAAREDLRTLKRYLAREFGSTVAAKSVAKVVDDISSLKVNPHLARPLSDKIGRSTPYLYSLAGKYSISILDEGQGIYSVIRILDGRTDYVSVIFGER